MLYGFLGRYIFKGILNVELDQSKKKLNGDQPLGSQYLCVSTSVGCDHYWLDIAAPYLVQLIHPRFGNTDVRERI